jgi:outer membrane biosynthesis protein TonB
VFVVKVSTEGRSLRVHAFKSSGDAAFDKAAESLVLQLQWRPATKGGTAVDGWTQLAVQPGSR